jgi:molecular chaperone GrpE
MTKGKTNQERGPEMKETPKTAKDAKGGENQETSGAEAARKSIPDGSEAAESASKDILEGDTVDGAAQETDADAETEASKEPDESSDVKYMRLAADFQNYKKRTEKERFERYTEGKKDFASDLLAVLDNFDRAISKEAAEKTDPQFFEGMEMVLKQFQDVLAKNSVKEIEALGAEFDPNMHHAVIMEPSKDFGSGKVSDVLQKGYALGEKIIRPAMVKVAE